MADSLLTLGCSGNSKRLPERSLDFTASNSQYLTMSGANFGVLNTKKISASVWYKRKSIDSQMIVFHKDPVGGRSPLTLRFNTSNTLEVIVNKDLTGTIIGNLNTTATFTDTSGWHQIVIYWDSANATSSDRLQLWHDGTRITSFSIEVQPSLNEDAEDAADGLARWGNSGVGSFYDGLLCQCAIFNNVTPSIGSLISGGHPVDITGISGLYSLLNTTASGALEDDYVLSTNWTNNNTVVTSTDIPT